MNEIIKFFLSFISPEKGEKRTKNISGLLFVIVILLLLNYSFSFTKQYKFEKDINNLKSIDYLLKSENIDEKTIQFLNEKKMEIINVNEFDENEIYNKPKTFILSFLNFKKFNILHYISSSWFLILYFFYMPFSLLGKDKIMIGTPFGIRLLTVLKMMLTVYIISILYANLLELIPIFSYNHLWYNYLFNFFSLFIILIIFWIPFSYLNRKLEYLTPEKRIKLENEKTKLKLPNAFEINTNEGIEKIIDKENPILWYKKINKYYNKKHGKFISNTLSLTAFIIVIFTLYSIITTIMNLIK